MAKVRPFISAINERCLTNFPNGENLSVDESMLPYFGKHGSKQRIANKPIRMGYKMWVMAESTGYVVQFEPYQGARHQSVRSSSINFGLGEQVVIDLFSELPSNVSYHVYLDNYFTSFRLLHYLAQNHVQATGVIRKTN